MSDTIVENSYYEHEEHGLVKAVGVSPTSVSFEVQQEDQYVRRLGSILTGKYEAPSTFKAKTEPADITVQAQPAVFNLTGTEAR